MLNNQKLRGLGTCIIAAECRLLPERDYILYDSQSEEPDNHGQREIIPFSIYLTAKVKNKTIAIGEIEGYLCYFLHKYPQHSALEESIDIEGIARIYNIGDVYDLTLAIYNKDNQFPIQWSTGREWCRERHFFALIQNVAIKEEYVDTNIGAHLISNIHNVIHNDCCISIDCVFMPIDAVPKKSHSKLRELGFTRIGGIERRYFARHTP